MSIVYCFLLEVVMQQLLRLMEGNGNMKYHCGFNCLAVIVSVFFQIQADVLIAPNDKGINYYGRFDQTDPTMPRFNWSGAIIEASFSGPVIGMKMDHLSAFYDIEIDGKIDTVISTGSEKDFIFRKDLSPQVHTVRIKLRSENHYGAGTFYGLYLADGKALNTLAKPVRKIEFIGDSHTAGYGVESQSVNCVDLAKVTDANNAFAALVTAKFHAQSNILAWSGIGMVRNYGASGKRSPDPYPTHYDQTLGAVWDSKKWDFSSLIPDLVVICLGTNDFSNDAVYDPDDTMFIGDYHKFIDRIYTNYPNVPILCVSPGKGYLDPMDEFIRRTVNEEVTTHNHPMVCFAAYPDGLQYTGCDYHPTVEDQKKIAAVLTDTIMKKMAWDTLTSTALLTQQVKYRAHTKISGEMVNDQFEIATTIGMIKPVQLLNLRGEILESRQIDSDGTCRFSMRKLKSGFYLAGNNNAGWVSTVKR
jgi:lysophospholipase L1-like esterase